MVRGVMGDLADLSFSGLRTVYSGAINSVMKWLDMLNASTETLRTHHASVRELAYNNARIAQGTRNRRTVAKLARQMGYLMTQVSMCENAARRRGISLAPVATAEAA